MHGMSSDPYRDREGAARPPGGAPLAYLITFRCYGTWLHGDERGSVDREHNAPSGPLVEPHAGRAQAARARLRQSPVVLHAEPRAVVHDAIGEVCRHYGWPLRALSARTNHVHVVVSSEQTPERAMNAFKSWCTRRAVEAGLVPRRARVWSRHGSTRYLWDRTSVESACRYVTEGQGGDLPLQRLPPRPRPE